MYINTLIDAGVAEFGRRKGLKIPRPSGRASSSLAPGTIFFITLRCLRLLCCLCTNAHSAARSLVASIDEKIWPAEPKL